MSPYIHHVPGRLRVKCAALRDLPERAQQIEQILQRVRGVSSVRTSVVTGSIIVHYEVGRTTADALLQILCEQGLVSANTLAVQTQAPVSQLADPLADAISQKLVSFLIHRSAAALIGAVL